MTSGPSTEAPGGWAPSTSHPSPRATSSATREPPLVTKDGSLGRWARPAQDVGDDHFLYASDVPHRDGEFPKNLKYLWNHPDLSQKTKEKIAYHNGKEYFQLDRQCRRPLAGKRTE